jgi:hypothetical protein
VSTSIPQKHEGRMTAAKATTTDQDRSQKDVPPYPSSWVDRFSSWVTRIPGPSWLYYFGIGLGLFFLQITVLWVEGVYPVGTLVPGHVFIAGLIPFLLALSHFFDNRADSALKTLRTAMKASEEEYSRLGYELTTLPARPTLLVSLMGVTFILVLNTLLGTSSGFSALATFPASRTVIYWMYVSAWWFVAAFLYHTIHQLRTIHVIYTRYTRVNLFRMRPLYALSSVTALTAASLTAITYGWLIINPGLLSEPISMAIVLPITLLAFSTFAWPLFGIHRLLVEEKGWLLDGCSLRLETVIDDLHQRVDEGKLEGMDDLNKTIASLEIEQNLLRRTPTWPWEPETVRLLITALALPLGLWAIQYLLQRAWGP